MKVMSIDFIRQVIEQTLFEQHNINPNYFGGKGQVNLFSFYEQLQEDYEVDRFKEVYDDLVKEQNRTGLIMNGTIIAPENPQMMNLNSLTIIPMVFTCSFRVALKDRDQAIETLDNLFKTLRGRKRDVACLDNGQLVMVQTIGNQVLGSPIIAGKGEFIGSSNIAIADLNTWINGLLTTYNTMGFYIVNVSQSYPHWFYYSELGKLKVAYKESVADTWVQATNNGEHNGIVYPSSHIRFDKYKLSISFDTIRIDEPKTLNAQEYCTLSFGGSATLVDNKVALGNDLTKIGISKYKIKADTDVTLDNTYHWLELLEQPNALGISSELSQLASHNFIQNKHNDGINPTFDYSFVLDTSESLIKQWWKYARYGIQGTPTASTPYSDGVTPNTLYKIKEIWSSWGEVEIFEFIAKATENIDIENTESDALTIKLRFEMQKE